MWKLLMLVFSTMLVAGGVFMIVRPDAAIRQDPELAYGLTLQRARRNARLAGCLVVFFGLAGLYAVLVEGLTWAPGGGF